MTNNNAPKKQVGKRQRLPCGCVSDDRAWLEFCDGCGTEVHELHAAAHTAHRATLQDEMP